MIPFLIFFKCKNEKHRCRRKQTAAGINKWASEAPLTEQIILKCQEKEGEPRRFPFQLQCGIWQHKQPYKQCPQNNSWTGRISAFITMTEREVNKPAPGSFCSYLEMKVTKLERHCRAPAEAQQPISKALIPQWFISDSFLYDPDPSFLLD